MTDGRTDRQTDRITAPKTALAYAGAVKTISNQNQTRLSKNDLKSKSKSLFAKRFQVKIVHKIILKIKIIQINLLTFLHLLLMEICLKCF